jgi:O-antigen/teichoic acid export membrane protein
MVVIIGSLVWGLYGKLERIEQVIFLQNICYLVAIGFVLAFLYRHIKSFHFNFNVTGQLQLLRQTLPFTGLILLTAICNRIDVVMLDFLRVDGAYQSGLYAAGYRFLDAANMFGFLFGALLLPMYAHSYVNKKDVNELFNTAFQFLMIISIFITLILCFYGKEIFGLLYTDEYLPHYNIMVALMLSLIPIMVAHSVGSLLVGTGRIFWMNITYAIGIVINIILNFIFIPKYGALGSAYTTLVTEIFLIVTSIILAKSLCNVRIHDFLLKKLLLLTSIAIVIILIFKTYFGIYWMIQVGLIACIYVSFLFVLKLVNIADWRRQLGES